MDANVLLLMEIVRKCIFFFALCVTRVVGKMLCIPLNISGSCGEIVEGINDNLHVSRRA